MFGLTATEFRLAAYGVLLAAICGWLWYHDHKIIAAHDARLEATSAALKAEAEKKIADLTAQHEARNASNQGMLDATLKANSVLSDTLDQRVRDFQAYRRSHPDVARPASGSVPAGQGECGARGCGEVAAELAVRGNELARSVGELSAVLQSAQRDRDSLTGLPR